MHRLLAFITIAFVACDATPTESEFIDDRSATTIIRACAPPQSLCTDLEAECLIAGVDDDRCSVLALGICPGNKCTACSQAQDACTAAEGECDDLEALCDAALGACDCTTPTCRPTTTLTLPQLFATCFAHPWRLGKHCGDPSAGQCFAVLQWSGCSLTTCEYVECAEDLALVDECGALPPSCKAIEACAEAEESP